MGGFSLRALVHEVASSSVSPDPGVIADEVDRRIGPRDCRAALRQMLRSYVRTVLGEERRATAVVPFRAGGAVAPAKWKQREARAWQRALRARVHVGESSYKFFGDCTVTDLTFAASERDAHAARNAAEARQYREAARLLDEHNVKRVKDLPADVLSRVLVAA